MQNSIGSIKLFLVDGVPDGILTAEIINWTGHVLYSPRSRIVDLLQRPEVRKTGLYLLIGEDPDNSDQNLIYVGEGDSVITRLTKHSKDLDKEFWQYVCVITSKDLNLTKAHVRYLESRMISLIRFEGRARLANKTEPDFAVLPEADKSDMDIFIARLQVLLPVIGFHFIKPTPKLIRYNAERPQVGAIDVVETLPALEGCREQTTRFRPTVEGATSPVFEHVAAGIDARAVEVGGQMIVMSGSMAKRDIQASIGAGASSYRAQLVRAGKLLPNEKNGMLRFTEDVAFSSPSAASQAVMGTSRNGRIDWIVPEVGITYAEWQRAEIEKAQSAVGL